MFFIFIMNNFYDLFLSRIVEDLIPFLFFFLPLAFYLKCPIFKRYILKLTVNYLPNVKKKDD